MAVIQAPHRGVRCGGRTDAVPLMHRREESRESAPTRGTFRPRSWRLSSLAGQVTHASVATMTQLPSSDINK